MEGEGRIRGETELLENRYVIRGLRNRKGEIGGGIEASRRRIFPDSLGRKLRMSLDTISNHI